MDKEELRGLCFACGPDVNVDEDDRCTWCGRVAITGTDPGEDPKHWIED